MNVENERALPPDKRPAKQPDLVSVVLPVFNEATGIQHTLTKIETSLQKMSLPYEIIVVDDGSIDDSYAVVETLCNKNPNLRVLSLSRNFGKEAAMLAGLKNAEGDIVYTMDADLQHPPEIMPLMLEKWLGGALVVNAIKLNRLSEGRLYSRLSRFFTTFLNKIAKIDLRDNSDFKLLDRTVVDVMADRLPERRRFYRGLASWIGFKQAEVFFDVDKRIAGKKKWSLLGLTDLALTAIVSFTSAPLRIVTFVGFFTLVFAILLTIDTLVTWFRGQSVSGFPTLIITLLLIGSFIMISLGIIGEYIAKIYDEIKYRPPYLIKSSHGFRKKLH